jgi:two-component system OmpR family sensor kinase
MRRAWSKLGLRGRLAISIGTIVVLTFATVFVAVRAQMSHESAVIGREEGREPGAAAKPPESGEGEHASPIADAQSDVEKTFFLVGGAALVAALLAGYLLAARTASPLRRFAATASRVDAGDLTPRLQAGSDTAAELRVLAEAFNHMLDRLDLAFARQRRFVSDASHELRSPLTAVRGQLEVLALNPDPSVEEVRHVERMALAEMARVERLVEDLLALARLDEGAEPALSEVEPASYLRGLAAADPGRAELGALAEGSIRIDPDMLAQVVRNLLSNAHRYAGPNGHVVLASRAREGCLQVSVEDDGPGVPAAERELIFERFHRTQSARDRTLGGSGLGLGISRSIVERHGGRIWVEGAKLGGARGVLELPGFAPRG